LHNEELDDFWILLGWSNRGGWNG